MKNKRLTLLDLLYLAMVFLPILAGILLRVLTKPATEGITVAGAQVYFTIPMPVQDLPITESQINSWLVILMILGLCLFLTRGLKTRNISVRQHLAEWLVEQADKLTGNNMGAYFMGIRPSLPPFWGSRPFRVCSRWWGCFRRPRTST